MIGGGGTKESEFVASLTLMSSHQHLPSSPAKSVFLPRTSRILLH